MTHFGRNDMQAHHDELVAEYNRTGEEKLLAQIAFLEMLLLLGESR